MQQILEYSFARVLTRLFGVVLVIWGGVALTRTIAWFLSFALKERGQLDMLLVNLFIEGLPSAVVIACGVYLARDGHLLARILTAGMHGKCRRCGYDTRGNARETCPECGTPIARAIEAATSGPGPSAN